MVADRLLTYVVGEQIFSLGSIVYINWYSPTLLDLPPGPSGEVICDCDQANLWAAKVLDEGAKVSLHVYLRLFWRYWPNELPSRRQPYYELIMSNAMDIVDVMTVAGPAEVIHWDEQKDDREDLGQVFRQLFDIKNLRGSKGLELSAIR